MKAANGAALDPKEYILSQPPRNAHLDLTIRAPNGSPWVADGFKAKDTVEEVIEKAVDHFVKKHIMQAGEYDLVLVVAGVSRPPLHPGDTLAQASVSDGAVLSLVPREKQVDG